MPSHPPDRNDDNLESHNPPPSSSSSNSKSLKRPLPLDATTSSDHPRRRDAAVKRRSSRACCTCRARKVRCDITINGSPCTNCRLDNFKCVLLESKRGPKLSHGAANPPNPASLHDDDNARAMITSEEQPQQEQRKRQRQHHHHHHHQQQLQREEDQRQREPDFELFSAHHSHHHHYQHYGQSEEDHDEGHDGRGDAMGAPMTPISSSVEFRATPVTDRKPAAAAAAATFSTSSASSSSSSTASDPPSGKIYEVAVGLTFDHDEDDGKGDNDENAGDAAARNTPSRLVTTTTTLSSHAGGPNLLLLDSASFTANADSPSISLHDRITFPSFIRPLAQTLAEDDRTFLEQKGAFTLPESDICDELVRSYVSTVHPFMPILDIRAFLMAFTHNSRGGDQISLLLFQAVMFAGLSALDPRLIQRMGFKTTKHARRVFFDRVRLLHDLDVEPDSQSVLQALLLMSLWYGGRSERRNTWYYTGLALSLAQNMGLHREPDHSHPAEQHLRRRLWWSLYIRDRLIALGTRRPMRIRDDDHEISMLSQQDFDFEPFDEPLAAFFRGGSFLLDVRQQTYLPLLCIELAKLCICIGHVLSSQYTTLGRRSLWTKALMVVPKQDNDSALEQLERCDRELADWYQGLHPDVSEVARSSASEEACDSTQWHWTVVDMVRLTLVSLLHRPPSVQPLSTNLANSNSGSPDFLKASKTKLKAAARELTRITHRMLLHDQVRYLPTSGVSALLSASLTHLLDLEALDDDIRDASIYRFDQVIQVLKQLRDIYASADSAMNYLGMVIRKTGISARVSQVAPIAAEFKCTAPTAERKSTAAILREPGHQSSNGNPRNVTAGINPRPNGHSRTDVDAAIRNLPPSTVVMSTTDKPAPQTMRSDPDNQNGNVDSRVNNSSFAQTSNLTEFGLVSMSEVESFGTPSLVGRDGSAVGALGDCGDRLDQQSLFTHENLFDSLSCLNYEMDPEFFNSEFDFYNDDLLWLGNGGERMKGVQS